jgi:hypothetical protein
MPACTTAVLHAAVHSCRVQVLQLVHSSVQYCTVVQAGITITELQYYHTCTIAVISSRIGDALLTTCMHARTNTYLQAILLRV